jgi:hypothetical protein
MTLANVSSWEKLFTGEAQADGMRLTAAAAGVNKKNIK